MSTPKTTQCQTSHPPPLQLHLGKTNQSNIYRRTKVPCIRIRLGSSSSSKINIVVLFPRSRTSKFPSSPHILFKVLIVASKLILLFVKNLATRTLLFSTSLSERLKVVLSLVLSERFAHQPVRSSIAETRWQRSKTNRVERRKRKKFHHGGKRGAYARISKGFQRLISRENLEREKVVMMTII